MNIWVHSELSAYKFGGKPEDYYEIHKFIDSSKLLCFNIKHRSILHHTFGIELCIKLLGDRLVNSEGETYLIRDIAAEHLKEDHFKKVPTLYEWFAKSKIGFDYYDEILKIENEELKSFVLAPYINSGLKDSLIITFSDFGIQLVQHFFSSKEVLQLRELVPVESTIQNHLKKFRFSESWQFSPDMTQVKLLNNKSYAKK